MIFLEYRQNDLVPGCYGVARSNLFNLRPTRRMSHTCGCNLPELAPRKLWLYPVEPFDQSFFFLINFSF